MNLLAPLQTLPLLSGIPVVLSDHSIADLNQDTGDVTDAAGNLLGNLNQSSLANILAKPTSNSNTPTTTPATTTPAATTSVFQDNLNKLMHPIDAAKSAANTLAHPLDAASSFIFTSRVIFLVVGLLLLGAGLFQFKTTQTVIEMGTKAAKLAAA